MHSLLLLTKSDKIYDLFSSVHLRPVMPLFMEDRRSFICPYPVVLSSFQALVVYTAKPYRVYVQPQAIVPSMQTLLDNMYEHYKAKGKYFSWYLDHQINLFLF